MTRFLGLQPFTIFKFAFFLLLIIINFVFLIFAPTFICSASLTRRTFFTMKQSSYSVEMILRRVKERMYLMFAFISR